MINPKVLYVTIGMNSNKANNRSIENHDYNKSMENTCKVANEIIHEKPKESIIHVSVNLHTSLIAKNIPIFKLHFAIYNVLIGTKLSQHRFFNQWNIITLILGFKVQIAVREKHYLVKAKQKHIISIDVRLHKSKTK